MEESPRHLVARDTTRAGERRVWFCRPTSPGLVLGSTSPLASIDLVQAAAAGVEVVRRRSGGGSVLVRPGELAWVDVFVPAGDRLWQRDVGKAFLWLGQAWAGALRRLGLESRVHPGPFRRSEWSSTVCFAGLGPGELTVGGRKVVGLSQRRTREGSLFSCAALLRWEPAAIVDLLALHGDDRRALRSALETVAAPVPADAARVESALAHELDRW